MNDIRRTILWVIFGFSMVLLWDQWQIHNGRPATFFPTAKTNAAVASKPTSNPTTANPAVPLAQTASASSQIAAETSQRVAVARERVTVSTDVLKLTFDNEGGALVQTEFLKHRDLKESGKNFVLLDENKDRVYVAQTGLIGSCGWHLPHTQNGHDAGARRA